MKQKQQQIFIIFVILGVFILGNHITQSKVIFKNNEKPKLLQILDLAFKDHPHCQRAFETLEGLKDQECQKILLGKVFGVLIIIVAAVLKLPQIVKIWDNKSVAGLTPTSFIFEMCALMGGICVNRFKNHSITVYGEQYLMVIQDLIILSLFLVFDKKLDKQQLIMKIAVVLIIFAPIYLLLVPDYIYKSLQVGNIMIILASRVPQIRLNHRNKSTGQLSGVTLTIETFGTGIRAATILQEAAFDPLIYLSISIAQGSILIIFIQFARYYNSKENDKFKGNPTKTNRDKYFDQIKEYEQAEQEELKKLYEEQQKQLQKKEKDNQEKSSKNKKQKTE